MGHLTLCGLIIYFDMLNGVLSQRTECSEVIYITNLSSVLNTTHISYVMFMHIALLTAVTTILFLLTFDSRFNSALTVKYSLLQTFLFYIDVNNV